MLSKTCNNICPWFDLPKLQGLPAANSKSGALRVPALLDVQTSTQATLDFIHTSLRKLHGHSNSENIKMHPR